MNHAIRLFSVSAVVFLIFDMLWLLVITRSLYQQYLGDLLGQVKIIPAIIFYIIYIVGILFFVVNPAIEKESLSYALFAGGFLGLLCYGTYDLTNLATIKDWPYIITILDLVWGIFVTAATSGLTFLVAHKFNWG